MSGFARRHWRLFAVLAAAALVYGRWAWLPWAPPDVDAGAALSHATAVILHLGVVCMLYLLLVRLNAGSTIAGAAVALLALHPLVAATAFSPAGSADMIATAVVVATLALATRGHPHHSGRSMACGVAAVVVASAVLAALHEAEPDGARSVARMLADAPATMTLQLAGLLWPRGLLAEYYVGAGDPATTLLALAAALAVFAYGLRRTAAGSIERFSLVLLATGVACGALLSPAPSAWYLPLALASLALATAGARWWPQLFGMEWVAVVLAVLSVTHAQAWSSSDSRLAAVTAYYPGEPRALHRLALAQGDEGRHAAAARTFGDLEHRFPDFRFDRGPLASSFARAGDLRRADAVTLACVRDRDIDCAFAYWRDLIDGTRQPETSSAALVGGSYEIAAPKLKQQSNAAELRRVAAKLREKGLELLARRAEADAAEKDAAAGTP